MQLRRSARLLTAAARSLLAAPVLSSCGFDYATDRVYTPGRRHQRPRRRGRRARRRRRGAAGRLGHLHRVVLQQRRSDEPATVDSIAGAGDDAALDGRASSTRSRSRPAAWSTSPTPTAAITVSGDFEAGDFVTPRDHLRRRRAPSTMDVPVGPPTATSTPASTRRRRRRRRLPMRVAPPAATRPSPDPRGVHDLHARPAPPRRERVERQEPLHRLGRRRPHRQGPRRGRPRRRAAARGRRAARRRAHLAAAPRDQHRGHSRSTRADRHWIPVRRSWRLNERHYGALQGKNKKETLEAVRRGAVHALAPLLRRTPAAARRRQRVLPGRAAAVRRPRRRDAPHRVPQGRHRPVPALLGVGDRPRPAGRPDRARRRPRQQPARAGQAPRRDQRRGHRRRSTSPPACRWSTSSTTTCAPTVPGGTYLDPEAAAAAAAAVANQGR